MEHNPWISFKVRHVNLLSVLNNLWMFSWHQPSNMRKEEAPICIMWIGISIGIFMMLSMISYPNIQAILLVYKMFCWSNEITNQSEFIHLPVQLMCEAIIEILLTVFSLWMIYATKDDVHPLLFLNLTHKLKRKLKFWKKEKTKCMSEILCG